MNVTLVLAGLTASVVTLGSALDAMVPSTQRDRLAASDARLSHRGALVMFEGHAFEGRTIETSADGTRIERSYADGRVNGEEDAYYADGRTRSIRFYDHGRKVGVHRGWWPDGTPQFERQFAGGEAEGLSRAWAPNGQLLEEHRYRAGNEDGLQKLWFADGSLRASYDVREGRRYGTIGAKPCLSEAHS